MAAQHPTNMAQQRWELENTVASTSGAEAEALYKYDADEQKAILAAKPWANNPHFFKRWVGGARISALALLKMAMHARSGGNIEVMGVMQGKVTPEGEFVVIDAFALPVEGTETRVNAAAEGYEYMVQFQETAQQSGRLENVVGWYHSHPGYGCWLSGIDVSTQTTNQRYQEPFLARSPSRPPAPPRVNTLSSSPLFATRELVTGQLSDIGRKLEAAEGAVGAGGRLGRYPLPGGDKKKEESKLEQVVRDTARLATEQVKGLSTQVIKTLLFNRRCGCGPGEAAAEPMET
eukprot:scaffold1.g5540.t1